MASGARGAGFWSRRVPVSALVLSSLVVTVAVPGVGAAGAFVIAVAAVLFARKQGSFDDIGFRAPRSWARLLARTLAYGLVYQLVALLLIEPLLAHWTGKPVDVSAFDEVRGNFPNFLILLAIGWVVGGFLEEFTFRGFVVGRICWLLGSGRAAAWFGVVVAAVAFGIAHAYQGTSGMIATGVTGFFLGAVYVVHRCNVWYPMLTHGFMNTAGILAIYLDIDQRLGSLVTGLAATSG